MIEDNDEVAEYENRLSELVLELQTIVPNLSPLLERWAKIRREINVITEELEKRRDVVSKTD